jgi:hypothetical protein
MTAKAIGHYLKTEKRSVSLDLGLSTNEVILFENDNVLFVEKSKLRDTIQINTPLPETRNGYPIK